MVNSFKIVKKLSKLVRLQGHPQRVAKVNKLWKSQFSNKFSFLNCSWKKSSDKLLPTSSRSLRNVLRLPSKVVPPTLTEWKSGSRSPKSRSWRILPGPQSTQRTHILGENPFWIPITEKFSFDPNSDLLAGQRPFFFFFCFEALFGLPEPDFHSASVGGATLEGSLKTFLRDLDGGGE